MPTPVTGTIAYQTPSTFAALEVFTTTEYNKVVKDVAYFRARPYLLAWQTNPPSPATLPISTNLNTGGTYRTLFSTGNGGSLATSVSTSSVGTITVASDGRLVTPSSLAGLYRFKAQMMVSSEASGKHVRVSAILYNAAGTQLASIPGSWVNCDTAFNALSICTFTIPCNVAGFAMGNVNAVKFVGQMAGTGTVSIVQADDNGNGPSSAYKQYNTFAEVEYLGTGTGSY